MPREVTPFVAQTITGTIIVTAAASSAGGAVPYLTPQQYGSPGPAATLAEAQAGPAQVAYIVKALSAAAANLAAGSGPTDVYLSPGYWLAIGKNNTYSWGGIPVPPGVSLYGAGVGQTYVTWNRANYGFSAFGVGKNSSLHDLTFTAPVYLDVSTAISQGTSATAVAISSNAYLYNIDCELGANMNCNTVGFGTDGAVMDNITGDGGMSVAQITQEIVAGHTYDVISCTPMEVDMSAGTLVYLYSYPTSGTRFDVLKGAVFQSCILSADAPVGATSLSVHPFVAGYGGTEVASLPVGSTLPSGSHVVTLLVATGVAMTGGYELWSTAPAVAGNPNWNVGSVIKNCAFINCMAANVFINMGYKSYIQNCYGSIGHDMNFDFEYCLYCIMQNNEGHFGGNRGCAVETFNGPCQVLNNRIYDVVGEDGIRVTNDLIPSGNPYPTGGHLVSGNFVDGAAVWGIAFQGTYGTIEGNTTQRSLISGIHLENVPPYSTTAATRTTISANEISYNYGQGIDFLNSENCVVDGTNHIHHNGWLTSTLEPNRLAPTLTLVSATGSTLASGAPYAVAFGYTAYVTSGGMGKNLDGPPGLPAFITPTASGQGVAFDVALPAGASGVHVRCSPLSALTTGAGLTQYPVPSLTPEYNAILGSAAGLGFVDAQGNVTYDSPNTSGITASVNANGSLHVVVTAPAAAGSPMLQPAETHGSGIWLNPGTGGVADVTIQGAPSGSAPNIHDNGYAGIYGGAGGAILDGVTVANHTAVGSWVGHWGHQPQTGGSYSGSFIGLWADMNGAAPATDISQVAFSDCIQCIHFDGPAGAGYNVSACHFTNSDVGMFITNQSVYPPYGTITVEGCDFSGVTTPVDLDGNPQDVLTIGSGNTGIPAA